jgi:hypothetical protein
MSIAGKNPNVTLQIFHVPTQGRQPRNSSGNISTVQETPEEKNHESHGDLIRRLPKYCMKNKKQCHFKVVNRLVMGFFCSWLH